MHQIRPFCDLQVDPGQQRELFFPYYFSRENNNTVTGFQPRSDDVIVVLIVLPERLNDRAVRLRAAGGH